MNNNQWNSRGKSFSKPDRILEVGEVTMMGAQVEALSRKIDNLSATKTGAVIYCLPDSRNDAWTHRAG